MLVEENLTTSCNKDIFTYTSDYEEDNNGAEDNESNLFLSHGTDKVETELEKRLNAMELSLEKLEETMNASASAVNHPLLNSTKGFHLYCIMSFAKKSETANTCPMYCSQVLSVMPSLALVIVQLISLCILTLESLVEIHNYNEDCANMLDCNTKQYYCNLKEEKCMRCEDELVYNCPEWIRGINVTSSFSREDIYTYNPGIAISEHDYKCVGQFFCLNTNSIDSDVSCPYWDRDVKLSAGTVIVVLFVSVLLAYSIYNEVRQVLSEEAILKYFIEENECSSSFAILLMRISLLLRKNQLPWYLASASVALMNTETLLVRNIFVNLLTITFVAEADEALGVLVANSQLDAGVHDVLQNAILLAQNKNISYFEIYLWPRIITMPPVLLAFCFVVRINDILEIIFGEQPTTECKDVINSIMILQLVMFPYFGLILDFFVQQSINIIEAKANFIEATKHVYILLMAFSSAWFLNNLSVFLYENSAVDYFQTDLEISNPTFAIIAPLIVLVGSCVLYQFLKYLATLKPLNQLLLKIIMISTHAISWVFMILLAPTLIYILRMNTSN